MFSSVEEKRGRLKVIETDRERRRKKKERMEERMEEQMEEWRKRQPHAHSGRSNALKQTVIYEPLL